MKKFLAKLLPALILSFCLTAENFNQWINVSEKPKKAKNVHLKGVEWVEIEAT